MWRYNLIFSSLFLRGISNEIEKLQLSQTKLCLRHLETAGRTNNGQSTSHVRQEGALSSTNVNGMQGVAGRKIHLGREVVRRKRLTGASRPRLATTASSILLFHFIVSAGSVIPAAAWHSAATSSCARETEECGLGVGRCCVGAVCRQGKCFTPYSFPTATHHHQGVGVGSAPGIRPTVRHRAEAHPRGGSSRSAIVPGRRDRAALHLGWLATTSSASGKRERALARARRQGDDLNGGSNGNPTCSTLGCGSDAWSFECSCDALCATVYFDCCDDYAQVCVTTTIAPDTTITSKTTTTTTLLVADYGSGIVGQQQSSSTPVCNAKKYLSQLPLLRLLHTPTHMRTRSLSIPSIHSFLTSCTHTCGPTQASSLNFIHRFWFFSHFLF